MSSAYSLDHLSRLLLWVLIVAFVLIFITAGLRFLAWLRLKDQPSLLIQLIPPLRSSKSPLATNQLFSVLHSLKGARTWLSRPSPISLELVSTRGEGIRYLVRLPAHEEAVIKQVLTSHLPDIKFITVKDYLKNTPGQADVSSTVEFKQTGHYAYPLSSPDVNQDSDPIAYLAGAMTKLSGSELLALQLVISPEAGGKNSRLFNRLARGGSPQLSGHTPTKIVRWLMTKLVHLLVATLQALAEIVGEIVSGGHGPKQAPKPFIKEASAASTRLLDSVQVKLTQPSFTVAIRALSRAEDEVKRQKQLQGLAAAFTLFTSPGHQALKPMRSSNIRFLKNYQQFKFAERLPSLWGGRSSTLAPGELASIYHFPSSNQLTENLVTSLSRSLPAPLSLKDAHRLDVVIGRNDHLGHLTPIGLTIAERERHVYVIGGTGNGKTTLLQYSVVQDFFSGKGVCVIDPHGDLAESLLENLPAKRLKDVIYFNPDDLAHPLGLNLLELPKGLSGDALLREQDLVAESIVSIFRKFFSDSDWGGHRIEYLLRNTVHTAFATPQPTIGTMYKLLTDPSFRYKTINTLNDEDLINFWREEFAKAGSFQRVKMASGVTTKLGRFLRSTSVARVMNQPVSTIDFDDIIHSGKILICNFSKGALGEDTSTLFGATILAKLQLAALRRARLAPTKRRPFYLYVDEFQNFSTKAFVDMLSEARKYKLFLTMAEQSTAQQLEPRLVNVILANVGTLVCFRTGSMADEQLLLPQFRPWLDSGDLANLPTYHFFAKLAAVQSQEPLSGETILLEEPGSASMFNKAKQSSRRRYGLKVS